jgi:hypothetical protein
MLRFYISRLSLLDSAGNPVAATLVDSTGAPLKYNLTFYDIAAPATQTVRLVARKGSYRGMTFSVGVPDSAPGIRLNHANAAQLSYPLDVDNDMYWGWNPGYVFFKVEGQSRGSGEWQPFVYHVGESKRLLTSHMNAPFTIAAAGEERTLVLNANRLFVTPTGGMVPNITGGQEDRIVHGEAMADSMAVNVAMSGFITLKP